MSSYAPTVATPDKPFAFVDVETTGGSASTDRLTEIAIVRYDGHSVSTWQSLINPECRIPGYIESLTGITSQMVASAPTFAQLAEHIQQLLAGHIFVAHNARFDYGFIKNAFRRVGQDFTANMLCTVKLSRRLYPQHRRHGLDYLIQRHGLTMQDRHRAYDDAYALLQFWECVCREHERKIVDDIVQGLVARPSLPAHIDPAVIDALPNSFGVYVFYGENELPIYIGKSNRLRQRVLSHFASDHTAPKEMKISMQIRRIEHIRCAGEVDALLTESRLIKEWMPTLNRQLRRQKDVFTWQLIEKSPGLWVPVLLGGTDIAIGHGLHLYGLFSSARDAKEALLAIIKSEKLCKATLGLEKVHSASPCFARQLKSCAGACVGQESPIAHSARLMTALSALRLRDWPFEGAALLREGNLVHVIHQWCYLGTARDETELQALMDCGKGDFSRDTYRILVKHRDKLLDARAVSLALE
ncbi:3'-5' exonuclease family protein [Advenella sp. FME57]|uniref:DNA-directed DNA polymerase n=1 Tax=Advenella kashmirensis TaxID=310575 RepID=A0A356LA43_9BURK|nr:3'-5' exonuclease family protein [Advenella sp. FME57]HBP27880.1 ethanolamine utilization protein [Advenella kashmirensis]